MVLNIYKSMLQVSSDPLAVLLIFPSKGLSAELLLLPYLKVEHDDGEEREEQMKDIRKCQQQADVHQVETHEGRVAAYPEYSVLHQLRPVFVRDACPPAVSHGQHGDNEEGNADGGDAKPCPLQYGAFPERREESHLRECDDAEYLDRNHREGCPSHNVLDQEDLPRFGALAYLVRGDALPALDKFLAQVSSIEYAHEGYCNIFLYHCWFNFFREVSGGVAIAGSADFRTGAILLGLQPVMSSYSRKSLHPAVFHLVSVGIVLLSLPDRWFCEGDSHDGGLLKAS